VLRVISTGLYSPQEPTAWTKLRRTEVRLLQCNISQALFRIESASQDYTVAKMPRNKTKRQRNRGGDAAEPSQSSVDDESTAIASSSAAEQSSAPTGLNSMLEVTGISE
jgi:hypothetical protein